jgi:hypothetical protein
MKLVIFAAAVLYSATSAFAQLEKGSTYLTAQVGGSKSKRDLFNTNSVIAYTGTIFNASIDYGYLFAGKWAVGTQLNYYHAIDINRYYDNVQSNQIQSQSESYIRALTNVFTSAFYVRRYFLFAPRLYAHIDGGFGGNLQLVSAATSGDKVTGAGVAIFLTPGASYFITKRFAITAGLSGLALNMMNWHGDIQGPRHTSLELKTRPLTIGASIYLR